jgi:asparagine synthase (glutamine-hydrolysing)
VNEPHTIYRDILKLPAASTGTWERGQLRITRYWDFQFQEIHQDAAAWRDQLDDLLLQCVQSRLESEVPLGVFLSGGIDSSAVVAYAHRAGLHPLKTFTIGFDHAAWDESDDAFHVARHFGTEHHRLELSESDLRANMDGTLADLVRHFDEPFGDDSALPTWHVSRLARQYVTVILSGDGGDELFAGYSSYRGARFAQSYRRLLPYWLGRHVLPASAELLARALPDSLRYRALRVAKVCRDSALPLPSAMRDTTSIFRRNDLAELLPRSLWSDPLAGQDHYLPDRLWSVLQSDRDIVSRLTEIDIRSYLLDDILVKVDRMSMAHSLEVRSPLLDHRLVEFAASLPSRFKLRRAHGKALLRDVLLPQLPDRARRKPKQGFAVPLRDWFRGPLAPLVHDYLEYNGGRLPDHLIHRHKVQSLLDEHRRGTADHSRKIWLLLVLATWHDLYQIGTTRACVASQAS